MVFITCYKQLLAYHRINNHEMQTANISTSSCCFVFFLNMHFVRKTARVLFQEHNIILFIHPIHCISPCTSISNIIIYSQINANEKKRNTRFYKAIILDYYYKAYQCWHEIVFFFIFICLFLVASHSMAIEKLSWNFLSICCNNLGLKNTRENIIYNIN